MAVTRISQSSLKQGLKKNRNFVADIPPILGKFDSIQTITVGAGGAASITFSNIPQTYRHLQFRCFFANSSSILDDSRWRWNNDSTVANYYTTHQIKGDGASATAVGFNPGVAFSYLGFYSDVPSCFSSYTVDILDYANTTKNKVMRSFGGYDANGSGNVIIRSSLWINTSAITSVNITPMGGSFVQHSSFALYGLRV